ncbi:hypothetical protein ACIQWR_13690 [Streptomyces sp. NPDC098789]|uniref:hypothetical protein n=1 Tax=Streptomyces sp. NPDC098789 TaxID=3366098 RepID=UPI00380281D1
MEIVYASLVLRRPDECATQHTAAEAVDALWAHALPEAGLQHVSARCEPGRIDFLLYLMSPAVLGAPTAEHRAHTLISHGQRTSPLLNLRFLPPQPLPATAHLTG